MFNEDIAKQATTMTGEKPGEHRSNTVVAHPIDAAKTHGFRVFVFGGLWAGLCPIACERRKMNRLRHCVLMLVAADYVWQYRKFPAIRCYSFSRIVIST